MIDIRLRVPGMKYESIAFMKVKYFKEGMEEKRKDILNINYVRALLSGRTPYSMGRSAEKAVQS